MKRLKPIIPYTLTATVLIVAGLIFMTCCGDRLPGRLGTFLGGVLTGACIIACVTDLKYRKILNSTTFSAILIVLTVHLAAQAGRIDPPHWGVISPSQAFFGFAACLLLTGIPFYVTHKGAGDVKLAVLFGAVLGAMQGIAAVVLAYLSAAVLLTSVHLVRNGVRTTFGSVSRLVFSWVLPLWVAPPDATEKRFLKSSMPLAPGFCLAAIVMLYRY